VKTTESKAAAAARIGAALGRRKRAELLELLRPCFAWVEPWLQAGKYAAALMSDLPRRNGWTLAERAGDRAPDRMQRLLSRAAWDAAAVIRAVRRFAVAGLDQAARGGGRGLAVGAIDETSQVEQGERTAGVKRRYLGCAGKVANGITTVHLAYAREGIGHALIAARQWIPREQLEDPANSRRGWEVRSAGTGAKGQRWYAWAWLGTASPQRYLLIRRHLSTGELAFHYCFVPAGQPVSLTRLVRAAGCRWPVEKISGPGRAASGSMSPRSASTTRSPGTPPWSWPPWPSAPSPPPCSAAAPAPGHPPPPGPAGTGWPGAAATRPCRPGTTSAPGSPETNTFSWSASDWLVRQRPSVRNLRRPASGHARLINPVDYLGLCMAGCCCSTELTIWR
jgi:DDE superfamily endonuclease